MADPSPTNFDCGYSPDPTGVAIPCLDPPWVWSDGYAAAPPPPAVWPEPELDQWTFVTTARLITDTLDLFGRLPPDLDGVVAIARSGLIPGTILATHLHVPLWSVSRTEGILWLGTGGRMGPDASTPMPAAPTPRHVLLLDDTAALGREMPRNTATVQSRWPGVRITRAVIYCAPAARSAVDLCAARLPGSHYLEWNWENAGHGQRCAYDFDGILCRDFTAAECADEATYRAVMAFISPKFLPRRTPVPLIVTARPESTRALTEDWLDRHGVRGERLVMRDFAIDPSRGWTRHLAEYKAWHYDRSGCILFAESDVAQGNGRRGRHARRVV